MSSYQFVNSLASCYANAQAQQQQQQQQQQGPRGAANSPGEPLQAPSPAGADYYNPNAASTGYPTPCYSPQQHYPQHPYATPAAGMQHPAPTGMIDYTQLQPQPRLNATATSQQQHAAALHQQSQHHQQHLQQQQQLHQDPTSPLLQAAAVAAAAAAAGQATATSCKYADSTSSTNVSSPQDLTTSTNARNSPAPVLGAPGTSKAGGSGQLTSPPGGSSRSAVAASVSSPPSGSGRGVGEGSSTLTTASSASSPASSTSSTSSTGNNSSNKGGGSGGNPPQIYPWMKRVHIGTSEYTHKALYFIFVIVWRWKMSSGNV